MGRSCLTRSKDLIAVAYGEWAALRDHKPSVICDTLIQSGVELLAALRYGYGRIEKNSIL